VLIHFLYATNPSTRSLRSVRISKYQNTMLRHSFSLSTDKRQELFVSPIVPITQRKRVDTFFVTCTHVRHIWCIYNIRSLFRKLIISQPYNCMFYFIKNLRKRIEWNKRKIVIHMEVKGNNKHITKIFDKQRGL
jgi:hypothetical protein